MVLTTEELNFIYDRTSGRCHLCAKKLAFKNYGAIGTPAAWEVDHSNPRARGGTNRRSNLLPACISCNRSKRDRSTRSERAANGRSRKPMSKAEIERARRRQAGVGAAVGALGFFVNPLIGVAATGVGALLGAALDPED